MTLQEFYSELEQIVKSGRYFYFHVDLGIIRANTPHGECCPVTLVCLQKTGKYYELEDWMEAAYQIELPDDVAEIIVASSDQICKKWDVKVRDELIEIWRS